MPKVKVIFNFIAILIRFGFESSNRVGFLTYQILSQNNKEHSLGPFILLPMSCILLGYIRNNITQSCIGLNLIDAKLEGQVDFVWWLRVNKKCCSMKLSYSKILLRIECPKQFIY